MATYVSSAGQVLVIRYPVPSRGTAASEPLPPIRIEPPPAHTVASGVIAFLVWEPYAVCSDGSEDTA